MVGTVIPNRVSSRSYIDAVPSEVAADASEAHECFSIGAWRASAAMARRALQSAAYQQGAPDARLVDQIDWLEKERKIPPILQAAAHRIRLGGNLGAHPDKDGLRDIGTREAEALLRFLDDFIRFVYELPAGLAPIIAEPEELNE